MPAEKVALVTGANKGIGLAVSHALAARGFKVWMGARDAGRGEEAAAAVRAAGGAAQVVEMDVTRRQTLERARDAIAAADGRLDALINNAGIAIDDGPPSGLSEKALRDTYETNVFGPVFVLQTLLPLVRAAPAGRVVNVSSSIGSHTINADAAHPFAGSVFLAYASSKAALNGVTLQFAKELRGAPVKINSACPGYVATDLNRHTGWRTVEQGAKIIVDLATLPDDGPTAGFFDENGPVAW